MIVARASDAGLTKVRMNHGVSLRMFSKITFAAAFNVIRYEVDLNTRFRDIAFAKF